MPKTGSGKKSANPLPFAGLPTFCTLVFNFGKIREKFAYLKLLTKSLKNLKFND